MIAVAQAAFDPDVEEALLRVYGVDSHRATLRRVSVLLRRLPPGTWQKDEATSWSREAWLLADLVDAVNQVAWMTAAVNSKRPPERPKPYPRPGQQAKQEHKRVTWADLAQTLAESG